MELSYGSADSSVPPIFIRQELRRLGRGYAPRRKYRSFSEGLLNVVATMEDKQAHECYINKDSQILMVLPRNILTAGDFHDGLAPIAVAANEIKQTRPPSHEIQRFLLGFIDKSGEIVIQPRFLLPLVQPTIQINFDHGVAVLRLEDCDEVIDKSGTILKKIPPGSLGNFHDGLARLRVLADKQGNFLDYKDTSHGIQNKSEYESAVTKFVQDQLKDLVAEPPIEFTITPARIQLATTDINKQKMVPEIVTQQQRGFRRPGAPAQTPSPYLQMIQEKLQAIKFPKRTFNLYGIHMDFILQNGQVRLKDPYVANRGELD